MIMVGSVVPVLFVTPDLFRGPLCGEANGKRL